MVMNMIMVPMEKIKIEHNIDDIIISKMDLILRVRLCHLDSDDDASHVGKESWQPDHPLVIDIVVMVAMVSIKMSIKILSSNQDLQHQLHSHDHEHEYHKAHARPAQTDQNLLPFLKVHLLVHP